MPNVRLILEYDGAGFHGWQSQLGVRTIQDELHKTLETVLREKIHAIHGAGRTDAGVHARGQVVNFNITQTPDLRRLSHAVSNILRGEVSVINAEIVPDDFHARNSARLKHYSYAIINRPSPAVLDRGRAWHISSELDIKLMQHEAQLILGEHDFTSFRATDCVAKSALRRIEYSRIASEPPYILYRVIGNGFLKQMVRNIVGTLVGLGKGSLDAKSMQEIFAAQNRDAAGVTAPAYGLCLERVEY